MRRLEKQVGRGLQGVMKKQKTYSEAVTQEYTTIGALPQTSRFGLMLLHYG